LERIYIKYVKRGEKEMNVRDIEINKIKQLENIRLRIEEEDVHTLMASIKQDGLLEPIAVATTVGTKDEYILIFGNRRLIACTKLGWSTIPAIVKNSIALKDFVIKNTLENVERQQITESELGRIFYMLKNDYNMTNSEIASRFGVTAKRVKTVINIYLHIPGEYREKIKYNILGPKKGNIPAKAADTIINIRRRYGLKKTDMMLLLNEARKDDFSVHHVEVVASLLARKYTVEEAVKIANDYTIYSCKIPILKKELESKKKKYKKPLNQLINEILCGQIKETFNIPRWKVNQ